MRRAASNFLAALVLGGVAVAAQDAKTTTDTKVKAEKGKVVTVAGCLEIGGGTSFVLSNVTTGQEHHTKSGPYALTGREGLDLGPYINHKVELTGVVVPPVASGDKDDKIKIRETDKVDAATTPNGKSAPATTTVTVPRAATTQFIVASVKSLAPTCP